MIGLRLVSVSRYFFALVFRVSMIRFAASRFVSWGTIGVYPYLPRLYPIGYRSNCFWTLGVFGVLGLFWIRF